MTSIAEAYWGYLIYRTVYTEESDRWLDTILQRIGPYVRRAILEDTHHESELRFAFPLIQDKEELEDASLQQLRERWNGQDRHHYPPTFFRNSVFLVLDEGSLKSFVDFADDDPSDPIATFIPYLKMVDGRFDLNDPDDVEERQWNPRREAMNVAVQHLGRYESLDREYDMISRAKINFIVNPTYGEIWVG
ncbi:hypothetical protein BT63DRAFT_438849 [Microthyrium microscopicum]|uniref:Uncharacterized protein n=1 Tax=Microthyrium microscopicum TaxID=703497 RepID=A0A6A6UGL0_9PEZI|nr:hypothetical protein BT63DRAFT_438849 [Microthyrium microscopicum]